MEKFHWMRIYQFWLPEENNKEIMRLGENNIFYSCRFTLSRLSRFKWSFVDLRYFGVFIIIQGILGDRGPPGPPGPKGVEVRQQCYSLNYAYFPPLKLESIYLCGYFCLGFFWFTKISASSSGRCCVGIVAQHFVIYVCGFCAVFTGVASGILHNERRGFVFWGRIRCQCMQDE